MLKRQPYDGPSRKLVLGFDVGTTFSGVSYCILEPGDIPSIFAITKFPGTERVAGNFKIPSLLYYDRLGVVRAAGAEADNIDEEEAAENGWTKAEWFKLHLCPKTLRISQKTDKIPRLPNGKSVVQVYADFLRYLYKCTIDRIVLSTGESYSSHELEATAEIVLTHPNGWEGGQQDLMRRAAIMADVIPDTREGRDRVFFVPEGEASLHFCAQDNWMAKIKKNEGILILDAGGGTIDFSSYKKTSEDPLSYEEIASPKCSLNGSVFVTKRAEEHFERHFNGSALEGDVPEITKTFDRDIKPCFNNANDSMYLRIGSWSINSSAVNVKNGRLKLAGSDIEKFFEPVIPVITQRILAQCQAADTKITSVIMVGGFSNSRWLLDKLKKILSSHRLRLFQPDSDHANKAVAHGAVSFRIDHLVTTRVAPHFYGLVAAIRFDQKDSEHISRLSQVCTHLSGDKLLGSYFDVILSRGTKVSEAEEFRQSYYRLARTETAMNLNELEVDIICFTGQKEAPKWFDEDEDSFSSLCKVHANLSDVRKSVRYSDHICGHVFSVYVDVILSFGSTEFKACIAWKENGVEKRSPAQMVYNPDSTIVDF